MFVEADHKNSSADCGFEKLNGGVAGFGDLLVHAAA